MALIFIKMFNKLSILSARIPIHGYSLAFIGRKVLTLTLGIYPAKSFFKSCGPNDVC